MDNPGDLGPATERAVQDLLNSGGYSSRDDVLRAGIEALRHVDGPDEPVDMDRLDPETRAAIEEGIAEANRGELIPLEVVRQELLARYKNW